MLRRGIGLRSKPLKRRGFAAAPGLAAASENVYSADG
jgi:hypothetical protein